mgnify:CR=1 FL=1
MSRRLKLIMKLSRADREVPLNRYAGELGCSLNGTAYKGAGGNDIFDEALVLQRIREAERDIRNSRMGVLALISAAASLASALAAWAAICQKARGG